METYKAWSYDSNVTTYKELYDLNVFLQLQSPDLMSLQSRSGTTMFLDGFIPWFTDHAMLT